MNKFILIDEKINKKYEKYLSSLKRKIIKVPKDYSLYDEISSHTDIHALKIKDKIVVDKKFYSYLEKFNLPNIISGTSELLREYPGDVKYNVCIIGDIALHAIKYSDETVLEYLKKYNYRSIDVSQGYTKCSTFVLDNKNAITSNVEIANKLTENGVNVLLLDSEDEENIKLLRDGIFSSMHGFIGGCMVRIDNKCILFGDSNKLKSGKKIKDFVEEKGYEFIEFKNEEVIDYGGIVLI